MLKRKKVKPITLRDVTIIDDSKLKKAITAASLGNAMELFDFGVYGFVAYALGKVFFPDANPSVQMIAALGTFSVPFLIRPLGGLFFGMLGDKYGRQKILAITIVIMSISTFCIGLIPSYATIGIWAPILLLLCKMAQGFSVGGEYTGASIFVAEYSPDRKRGFMGSWLDFGSIAGFVMGAGVVVLISSVVGEENFLDWGWRIPFFLALPLGIIGLYLRHASRTVLMNIINAIKTGDVKRAPRLEAMLSKAIETNKQRELSYVRQATIDALTGCKNRRAFDSDIAALMNDHQPFALALVDIDNFKSINDTWGHLNGDIVLRNVAREGLQVLQPLEISLYRYGGEEFAVVFPAEHIDNARTLLETWRVNVERRTWREDGLTVTFSAGLGEWNMEPLDKLVVSVDEALYKAKQQGKNRIVRA